MKQTTLYVNGLGRSVAPYPGPIIDSSNEEAALAEHASRIASQERAAGEVTALASLLDLVENQAKTLKDLQQQISSSFAAVERIHGRLSQVEGTVDSIENPDHQQMVTLASQIVAEGSRARLDAIQAADQVEKQMAEASARHDQFVAGVDQSRNLFADLYEGMQERAKAFWSSVTSKVDEYFASIDSRLDQKVKAYLDPKPILVGGRQESITDWRWQFATMGDLENIAREVPMETRVGARGPAGRTVAGGGAGGSSSGAASLVVKAVLKAGQETALRLTNPSNTALPGRNWKGPAGSLLYHLRATAPGTEWVAGRLDMAAALLVGEESFTVASELMSPSGEVAHTFRVVRLANGETELFITSAVDAELRGSPVDVPSTI